MSFGENLLPQIVHKGLTFNEINVSHPYFTLIPELNTYHITPLSHYLCKFYAIKVLKNDVRVVKN